MNVDRSITFVPSMAIADIACVVVYKDVNITLVVSLYGNHGIVLARSECFSCIESVGQACHSWTNGVTS